MITGGVIPVNQCWILLIKKKIDQLHHKPRNFYLNSLLTTFFSTSLSITSYVCLLFLSFFYIFFNHKSFCSFQCFIVNLPYCQCFRTVPYYWFNKQYVEINTTRVAAYSKDVRMTLVL